MMEHNTRIWWDGSPVRFIRWTEKGLVFNWEDPNETAIHMPRGTVMRLMAKGVLEIEGYLPTWAYVDEPIELQPNRRPSEPAARKSAPPKMSKKLNIITRLINKLSGGDPSRVIH